jgi:hypothetical protein
MAQVQLSEMNRITMLTLLSDEGENAGSDYNDSERVHGRFGWTVEQDRNGGGVLSVTYEDQENELAPTTHRWVMIPMGSPTDASAVDRIKRTP